MSVRLVRKHFLIRATRNNMNKYIIKNDRLPCLKVNLSKWIFSNRSNVILFLFQELNMMSLDTKIEKLEVELKLLVNLALDERVSWAKIKGLLDDMTSTYETSKKLNTVLLEELQSLHSKTIGNQSHGMIRDKVQERQENIEIGSEVDVIQMSSKLEAFNSEINNDEVKIEEAIVVDIDDNEELQLDQSAAEYDSVIDENGSEPIEVFEVGHESNGPYVNHDLADAIILSDNEVETKRTPNQKEILQSYKDFVKEPVEESSYQQVHDSFPIKCKDKEKMESKSSIQSKVVFINGQRRFLCKTCGQVFTLNGNLKQHEKIHSGQKPFECQSCPKKFKSGVELRIHDRIHTGEKPYECNICKKAFSQSCTLKSHHNRVHNYMRNEEKPYGCENCLKRFHSKSDLSAHQRRNHSEEKPLGCKSCPSRFITKSESKLHERIHTGEKPFECQQCKKAFSHNCTLKSHMKIHNKEAPMQ